MKIIDVEKYNFSKEKLLQYGFREEAEKLIYRKEILDSSFLIEIVFVNSQLLIEVYDIEFDEIYSLYSVDSAVGETVQNIREHVEKLLSSILGLADESGKISSEIIDYCNNKYGGNHVNPFKKHPDILAFVNEKNKWYALMSNVEYNKLNKTSNIITKVKILNVKYPTDKILEIIDNKNIFPAYHMNKKHWISIVLDKNIKLETIKELIDISYSLVK
ncbi:MAG: MmcQ/YjbR family DNA-binding protein [Gemella haemolysans]|uniref:MmcQ/YjbR family DNA-binding protein n=1 Tax=Gemella haemolysans TaxID=1379 RepID=UPI0029136F21|nr:MmcQ/YjbR family DNA-binding protein [Gemella haemolysans]MDU4714035.1 MmcQ/YjbR family DNA-binding protein [Gemella haemolysans]